MSFEHFLVQILILATFILACFVRKAVITLIPLALSAITIFLASNYSWGTINLPIPIGIMVISIVLFIVFAARGELI